MTILLVLIPLGLMLLGIALTAFVWAVRHGQFDDLDAQGAPILFDRDASSKEASAAATEEDSALR